MSMRKFLAALALLAALSWIVPVAAEPLSEFPSPFVKDGLIDYDMDGTNEVAIILGETGRAEDVLGAALIAAKIGTHLYYTHAKNPPEPFKIHAALLKMEEYVYDLDKVETSNAPVVQAYDPTVTWPAPLSMNYMAGGYLMWGYIGENYNAINISHYTYLGLDPETGLPMGALYYKLGFAGLTGINAVVFDLVAQDYFYVGLYPWAGKIMFYQDPAAVIDRNWAFAFYEPRALWLVGSEYEIEWAGGYRLQITNIRINEDFADDLESTNHIVSFALISPEGEIVDCWQQNISQIHVEVVPLDLGPAALFIHVSKVCPDANCAYVWVQSYPIHKHVSNPALNILSIAEDSYGISAGWSDDNPGNEWIDVNGNGVREPFPGPDMVEGWGGNLYRTEEGTDYIETYDTEVGDFWYYTLTADFLLLGSDAYGIDTYWAPCGLYSPEAWRRWWRWEGIPIELPPMYWVRAHHWVWAEGKKLIKEEYVSIYTGAILIDYVKTTEWMAWQLNETKVYDGRRYFFGNLPYIAEAAEKEGLVTEPMALEKLKWQATIYEVVETTIDTKEPLYKLEEWVPLRYVFYPWEWNSWTLAGQVDGQNYYTAIYNNSEYVKPEGSDRAQCISIDPQTGLPFASWMTVPETFIGPVYSHRVLLVDLKLLKEIIGTDVTGTFAGIFDQFVGGPGVEYTGTLLISFENYTDITPPSEKDIIFEGEDVFSFFHAPFVYIAGTEAAEKAKTSCALILVGGPIVNSYVKELNDTGKLWITFIGTDKVQDWTGKVWTLEDVAATLGWPVEYVPKVTSGIGTVQYAKENPWNPDPTVPVLVVAGCDRFGTYAAAVALADPTKILRETASAWWEAGRNTQPPAVIVLGIVPGIPIPVPVAPPPGVVFVGIGPAPKETPLGG